MSGKGSLPCVLTVAGSDSGGGAGIQADVRTLSAFGVHPATAVAALTAQNSRGVADSRAVEKGLVVAQIRVVAADFPVRAVKTGMLVRASLVNAVAGAIAQAAIPNLVVDPVIASKSGATLLSRQGIHALIRRLLPLATVVTPNLPEAEILVGRKLHGDVAIREAAREIQSWGPSCVVIKGGHLEGPPTDLFFDGSNFILFQGDRIGTRSDHGTGCTFSAAIAALLARGMEPGPAVGAAKAYVNAALRNSPSLGKGRGPLHHFYFLDRWV